MKLIPPIEERIRLAREAADWSLRMLWTPSRMADSVAFNRSARYIAAFRWEQKMFERILAEEITDGQRRLLKAMREC